jgi:Na+-transporting methylmalonyl-CoA/oxaloacetate decarboxylase, beta subunit
LLYFLWYSQFVLFIFGGGQKMKKISLFLLIIPTLLAGCAKQDPASIGVIGGADGPTAIYIASKLNWFTIALGIIVVILAISLIAYFFKKKK